MTKEGYKFPYKIDTVIVSYDHSNGVDNSVLIVGRKEPAEAVKIINTFQGKEAEDIYKMLVTRKDVKHV